MFVQEKRGHVMKKKLCISHNFVSVEVNVAAWGLGLVMQTLMNFCTIKENNHDVVPKYTPHFQLQD